MSVKVQFLQVEWTSKKERTQYVTKICSVIVWLIPEPYLIGAAEERFARVHLHQDTAQGPHVYSQVIRHAQQHLRRAVKTDSGCTGKSNTEKRQ